MLTITDNITKDVETVEVKVTDCYLAYVINASNHPVLPAGTTLFLVNNQAQDYYLFDQDNTYNKPILKDNGYEFFIKLDAGTGTAPTNYAIPNLRLYKHNPADAATTTSEFYDFQIEMYGEDASSSYVLKNHPSLFRCGLGGTYKQCSDQITCSHRYDNDNDCTRYRLSN